MLPFKSIKLSLYLHDNVILFCVIIICHIKIEDLNSPKFIDYICEDDHTSITDIGNPNIILDG